MVYVPKLRMLFAGDLVFRGRVPFVGQADSGHWITALDELLAFPIDLVVPGHGPASSTARADLEMTRDYLVHLLARHKGNISRAALEAGIDRNYIHRLVKKYGLDVERG